MNKIKGFFGILLDSIYIMSRSTPFCKAATYRTSISPLQAFAKNTIIVILEVYTLQFVSNCHFQVVYSPSMSLNVDEVIICRQQNQTQL